MNIDNLSITELFELFSEIGLEILVKPVVYIPIAIIWLLSLLLKD